MYNGNYEVASLVYIYMYMYVQKRYFPLCQKQENTVGTTISFPNDNLPDFFLYLTVLF